jgi:mono/diheme cytochrome c family protein
VTRFKGQSVAVSVLLALLAISFCALADETAPPWTAPARAAKKKNPVASDENSIAAGKVLYVKECLSCHGDTGRGDGKAAKDLEKKPGDLSNAKMWDQTDGALFWKITEGNKPMPSFDKLLSEDDRWNVVNYVHVYKPKDVEQPK